MKINRQLLTIGILAGLAVATVSTHASASVSNPQNFEWDITTGHDSLFQFKSGAKIFIDGGGTGYFSSDVDSSGNQTGFGTGLPSGSMTVGTIPISALVQIQSGSTGSIDPAGHDLRFILSAKVRLTYNGSTPCTTSAFTIQLNTANWSAIGGGACSTGYDESSGDYCVYASGFTVPAVAGTACGGNGTALNNALSLGTSTGTVMQILLGNVNPIIVH